MTRNIFVLTLLSVSFSLNAQHFSANDYYSDLMKYGEDPLHFVNTSLSKYDLLVFDDALHNAYEPFVFYNQVINDSSISKKINYIFVEVISMTCQPDIDSFLNSSIEDSTLLIKMFQDDYSGMGWRYQTFLDLFKAVWQHNKSLVQDQRIRIIGVNPPVYWEGIHTLKDYELFQNSLKSRDYFMYVEIVEGMKNFAANKKGIFLCNTRHAYKNVRKANGELYWNTTTFFNQFNPGKVFSIRIHNATLSIEAIKQTSSATDESTGGLGDIIYKWIEMDNGRWDSAFAMNSNRPVALRLANSSFGKTKYVGNSMLNVKEGTTMQDTYNALIFLAPLNELHFSAKMSYIYTLQFKPELERRVRLINGKEYANLLKENRAIDFDDFYNSNFIYSPVAPNKLIQQ